MSLISWRGSLALDERLEGYMGDVRVAAVKPENGQLYVAYTHGLQCQIEPVASVKEAKTLGEEGLRDFLLDMRVRQYTPGELVIVEALLATKCEDDEAAWRAIAETWAQQHFETQELVDGIGARLLSLKADVDRRRERNSA